MRFVVCRVCARGYCICGNREEITLLLSAPEWKDGFPCITPLCRGRLQRTTLPPEGYVSSYEEVPLTAFYRAINGFGSPNKVPAAMKRVKQVLTTRRVVEVVGEPAGNPERTIIRQLVLDNGIRLHFDSSSKGACLYYVEEPGPSCLEVVDNELGLERTAEGNRSNREEAGRGSQAVPDGSKELKPRSAAAYGSTPWDHGSGVPAVPEAGDLQDVPLKTTRR